MDTNEEPIAREPVATARANLSEITAQVRIRRTVIILTRRDKPQAALVPYELAEAVHAVGGPDEAVKLLWQVHQAVKEQMLTPRTVAP